MVGMDHMKTFGREKNQMARVISVLVEKSELEVDEERGGFSKLEEM